MFNKVFTAANAMKVRSAQQALINVPKRSLLKQMPKAQRYRAPESTAFVNSIPRRSMSKM